MVRSYIGEPRDKRKHKFMLLIFIWHVLNVLAIQLQYCNKG